MLAWNELLAERIREDELGTAGASRTFCLLDTSIYDAVNGIDAARPEESHCEPYAVDPDVEPAASRPAAANAAGHEVLTAYFGTDPRFEETFATIDEGLYGADRNVRKGTAWGREVASEILALRADDGHDAGTTYEIGEGSVCTEPACFRYEWGSPHFSRVDPWTWDVEADGRDAFRPDGPPPLDGGEYAASWIELHERGEDRADRPPEQVEIAEFWRGGAGTTRPSGRWMVIGLTVASEADLSISETARLFAHLALALGDAVISTWECKAHYGFWRPITAIREADADGNDDTFADEGWTPLAVGGSPEYSSGLAAFGGAGRAVLVEYFGDGTPFDLTLHAGNSPEELSPTTRSFDSFSDALSESMDSRVYVGNHFRFTLDDSREAGEEIGEHVLETHLTPVDSDRPGRGRGRRGDSGDVPAE